MRSVLSLIVAAGILAGVAMIFQSPVRVAPSWGATFSFAYAEDLKIDARATFEKMLIDFPLAYVRLPVDWDRIEKTEGTFDWEEIDWAMELAEERGVHVVLAVGEKTPRWPECHTPRWVGEKSKEEYVAARLTFIKTVVERYASYPVLLRWQVENEPLFPFGECPLPDPETLVKELALVRALDPMHPVQLTVSGELEPWTVPASLSDTLGFSLYRKTFDPILGDVTYPLDPGFYRLRRFVVAPLNTHIIVSELQVEPWFSVPIDARTPQEWVSAFDAEDLRENIMFAQETGTSEIYLWGVEWWAYLAKHGEPSLWEAAGEMLK